MQGVVGLQLRLLRMKAGGQSFACEQGTDLYAAYDALLERGLLQIIGHLIERPDVAVLAITPMGRVVLEASEATSP